MFCDMVVSMANPEGFGANPADPIGGPAAQPPLNPWDQLRADLPQPQTYEQRYGVTFGQRVAEIRARLVGRIGGRARAAADTAAVVGRAVADQAREDTVGRYRDWEAGGDAVMGGRRDDRDGLIDIGFRFGPEGRQDTIDVYGQRGGALPHQGYRLITRPVEFLGRQWNRIPAPVRRTARVVGRVALGLWYLPAWAVGAYAAYRAPRTYRRVRIGVADMRVNQQNNVMTQRLEAGLGRLAAGRRDAYEAGEYADWDREPPDDY